MRNAPEGSTVTRPGGLVLIYVARGSSIHSLRQSLQITKISKSALSTFWTAPTTTHCTFAGLSALDPHHLPTIECAKPHEAVKL